MFSKEDTPHPDWEMRRSTQRKFSIATAIIFVVVVLLNMNSDQQASIWADQKPGVETLMASQ